MRRTIEILCIKGPHVVTFTDNHLTKEGEENSLRSMTRRVLSKRITLEDGSTVPTHVVKAVGKWKLGPKEVEPERDEFDELLERQTVSTDDARGKRWHELRRKNIEKSDDHRREAEAQLERARGGDVAKAITEMTRSIAGRTSKGVANG